jgi:hypothetical protein
MNRLYFGDNLAWLRNTNEFPNASVDLVYLDPPFNSNADYNVLFRETSGEVSQAQFHAFTDTWSWADAAETYHQFIDDCPNVAVVDDELVPIGPSRADGRIKSGTGEYGPTISFQNSKSISGDWERSGIAHGDVRWSEPDWQ